MYNRVYKYLTENNLLYKKTIGFQSGHSTDHVTVQLVDQVLQSLENDYLKLEIFIDLSKAFNTVDHSILYKKLEMYGIHES